MKFIRLFFIVLAVVGCMSFSSPVVDGDIYLFFGASNMSGRGKLPSNQLYYDTVYNLNDSLSIVLGREPSDKPAANSQDIHKDNDAGYSPVMSFMGVIQSYNPNKKNIFINCAHSGVGLHDFIDKSETSIYGFCLRRFTEAKNYGTLRGIIFIEGESESEGSMGIKEAQNWSTNFGQVIISIRSDFGNVPVVYLKNNSRMMGIYNSIVREQQESFESTLDNVSLVNADDIFIANRSWHYGTSALKLIGKRLGLCFLENYIIGNSQ